MDLKTRIENLLSEILSDKYECKVTLRFDKNVSDIDEQTPTICPKADAKPAA